MRTSLLAFTLLSASLAIPLAVAQKPTQARQIRVFRGEAFFLERIALPPRAMLHVSLVGRIAGAQYLPLATTVVAARGGITPFQFVIPSDIPAGPYRLQAWIIADNRAMFVGRDPQTIVTSLDKPAKIRLKIAPAPRNIDGIGDGKPLAANSKMTLKGTVSKLDRRALVPDSRIELQLRDASLADAPAPLVMGQVIQLEGGQLPKTFELEIEKSDLQPRRRYALSARVLEAGRLTYISDTIIPVTPENAAQPFEIRVVSVPQTTP